MDTSKVLEYCLSKKGAYVDFPFGPEPTVIKVGSKIFALITNGKVSLKCDSYVAETLRSQYPAITPGYHLNKAHWNTILINGTVPNDEMVWMIDHSYDLVFKSLSKSEKQDVFDWFNI